MADQIGIGIPSPPKPPAAITPAACARAAAAQSLAAACIAAPGESELSLACYALEVAAIERGLHYHSAAARAAREASR